MTEQDVDRLHVPQTQSVHLLEADEESDPVRIQVPLASTDVNRDGHKLTMDGVEDIADQLRSGEVPLYMDHGLSKETGFREYTVEDMIGKWVDAEVIEDEGVVNGTAKLDDSEAAETLVSKMEQEMPVGFSIGFIPNRETAKEMDDGGMKWNDVDLLETSAVGIPSDPNAVAAGAMIAQAFNEAGVDPEPDRIDQVVQHMTQEEETNQEDEEEFLNLVRELVNDELESHREMLKSDMEAMFEDYLSEDGEEDEGDMDEDEDDEGDTDEESQSFDELKEQLAAEIKEEVREEVRRDVAQELMNEDLETQDPEATIQVADGEAEETEDADDSTAGRWVQPKR